ncbi:DnaJ domain-containing protein [Myxococcota bacterium]|nr:DnaJ domain-containing protein [Myxococcota bacterium]
MALPAQVYLRHKDGESIGPLPLFALEVLYDARVVDDGTPVSHNGFTFKALRDLPEILLRVQEVKEQLGRGEDPWATPLSTAPAPEPEPPPPKSNEREPKNALAAMLRAAAKKSTGQLTMAAGTDRLVLTYKDGKIVSIESNVESLTLARFLVDSGMCTEAQIAQGIERAPMMGGDLGGALISLGLVPPHTYFEKFLAWAKNTLKAAVTHGFDVPSFAAADVANPPVPLGFDRFGVLIELVREAADRTILSEALDKKKPCPLIPSHVEGVTLDELKLKPGELRVMNALNGAKTYGEILESFGGNDAKTLEVQRIVFFGEQTGLVVVGDDPLIGKELQEATKLREQLERMKTRNYFELLGITEKDSDDSARQKYTDLAKVHHPDKLRQGAAPELVEVRREIFAVISEAFEALQTSDQRYKYSHDLSTGRVGSADELAKVQAVLRAETLFKKAEILSKVKKYDEALACLDEAIQAKPDDTEFKVYRAYYGYLYAAKNGAVAEDQADKAIKQILALMKNDANIASGYMFLGLLNKAVNKPQVAVRYFEKVLEYDDKNPEAMREVRLAKLRDEKTKKKGWF